MQAICLWSLWQAILVPVAVGFTRRGQQRFVEWVTGLALNVQEHTLTQSLLGLERVGDCKALESNALYGAWNLPLLPWGLRRRLEQLPRASDLDKKGGLSGDRKGDIQEK